MPVASCAPMTPGVVWWVLPLSAPLGKLLPRQTASLGAPAPFGTDDHSVAPAPATQSISPRYFQYGTLTPMASRVAKLLTSRSFLAWPWEKACPLVLE